MRTLIFIFSFLTCIQLFAQRTPDPSFKKFGVIAGLNIANMNFNQGSPTPAISVPATWRSGVMIGLLVRIPLVQKLYLEPEYFYTRRRGADKSTGLNYLADYFSLPILLNYRISPRFSVLAGLQPELLIRAKEYNNDVDKSITHDTEERSVAITAGFNVHLYKSFVLSARYLQGLNHIGIGQRSSVKEFKYEVMNFCLEYDF